MKEVVRLIEKAVAEKKIDPFQGLNVLLDFLVDLFDVGHYKGNWMEYVARRKNEEPTLFKICLIWMERVSDALDKGTWLDFFGGIYEELFQSKYKASKTGQFFTPPAVCDLLAKCATIRNNELIHVNDCACGSGRTLLSQFAVDKYPFKAYYIADDIDEVSVKMCALNMMMHGMRGKVVQHDTLTNPVFYDLGYEINEVRYPIPTSYYSLRKIKYTKEDLERDNKRVARRFGNNVVEKVIPNDREAVKVLYPKGTKPKPIFKNKEVKVNSSFESTQLNLFGDNW